MEKIVEQFSAIDYSFFTRKHDKSSGTNIILKLHLNENNSDPRVTRECNYENRAYSMFNLHHYTVDCHISGEDVDDDFIQELQSLPFTQLYILTKNKRHKKLIRKILNEGVSSCITDLFVKFLGREIEGGIGEEIFREITKKYPNVRLRNVYDVEVRRGEYIELYERI